MEPRGATNSASLDLTLDSFGQRLVTIFTQITFCFQIPDDRQIEDLLDILTKGNERLAHHFPWLAGQVVCEGATEGNTGTFKIKPLNETPRLQIKNLRNDDSSLSWSMLQQTGFPMNALDENIIAPRQSYSGQPGETVVEVFQLQATILQGGMILTFLGQHQTMDGVGQGQIIELFSKACRNEAFTKEELRIGNMASEYTIKLLDHTWVPGLELKYNIVKEENSSGPGSVPTNMPADKGVWSLFGFSASSLQELKSSAIQSLPLKLGYVSTDDVLSAFVLQSISRARLPRLGITAEILCARAVDLRRYLEIPQTHPGFIQSMTYHSFTTQQVTEGPLGVIAADFRVAVDPNTSKLAYHARSFATLISRTLDKTKTSYIAGLDMSKDVMISSWANQNSYQLDFGLQLGKPQAVRRPRFDGFQGLVYFMPRMTNGDIDIALCLDAEDMEILRRDDEFSKHATNIG